MRMSLKAMLKGIDIDHVDLAKSGEEAVLRCDEHDYDIIICDYQLSKGKTGLQVLEELRAKITLLEGDPKNIKITYQSDI